MNGDPVLIIKMKYFCVWYVSLKRFFNEHSNHGFPILLQTEHQLTKDSLILMLLQMTSNFSNIKRAMMTFDLDGDGFVRIDDLKAVLDNFVIPTTDEIFHQLMYR